MNFLKYLGELRVKRQIKREQALRERCIKYAGDGNTVRASLIYRFIVRGTLMSGDEEVTYPNLEGVIHSEKSLSKNSNENC